MFFIISEYIQKKMKKRLSPIIPIYNSDSNSDSNSDYNSDYDSDYDSDSFSINNTNKKSLIKKRLHKAIIVPRFSTQEELDALV